MSESFQAGFAARHALAATSLAQAFAPPSGFAPRCVSARPAPASDPRAQADAPVRPRHFAPADRSSNPTQGWDPLDAASEQPAPFVDPIAAARAAGYAEGLAAAAATASAAAERDQAMLAALLAQLNATDRVDRDQVARQLRETVLFLVSKLVGEIGVAGDLLAQRVAAAAEMLADSAESALLRVHPEDVALLEGRLPRSMFAVGDAAVARGSFVLEAASTIVEDGPELWLEQLSHAIERVALPC